MLKQALYSVLFLSICGSPLQIFGANPDYSSQNSSYGIFDFFYPKPTPEDLQKEIATLKSELEKLKEQQSELIAIINATKSEIVSSRDQQKRRIDDSNELERILVKYGNTTNYISVLSQAIEAGDINAVNLLLANGADVNAGKGQALSTAARHNQIEIAQILLEMGADVNFSPYEGGYYPIYYAAQFGSGELIDLFIKNGAFLDKIMPIIGYPNQVITPLHIAVQHGNYEAVVALVEGGAQINVSANKIDRINTWKDGNPLDYAVYNLKYKDDKKNLDLIMFLVENGAERRCGRVYNTEYNGNGSIPVACPVISGYLKGVQR